MLGHSLHDYMIAQEKACADLKLPFVNLMRQTLFDPSKKSFRKNICLMDCTRTKKGIKLLLMKLSRFLNRISDHDNQKKRLA